jgi:hypothetical protein
MMLAAVLRIRIHINQTERWDPHQSEKLYPDPHQSDKLYPDPNPHQSGKLNLNSHQFADKTKCMENEPVSALCQGFDPLFGS